ncbi:MAG: hypothetical protein R2788_12635 [Saprospiraceae bacterium]
MLNNLIRFFLENKLVAWLLLLLFVGWGIVTAPFDFGVDWLPRDPVAVDAIPISARINKSSLPGGQVVPHRM